MSFHRIQAIAFDLDGTLVDSAPDVAHALNAALAEVGLPAFDGDTVRGWIGDGPDATIERALQASALSGALAASSVAGASRSGAERDALARQLRASFDAATLRAPLRHGRVYDGIADLLHGLAGRWPLAVITNKPTPLARAVLAAAGLAHHFAAIFGADEPAHRKPSPALPERAAEALGVQPSSLLMVGDGLPDLHAARNAGCAAAWVEWGYGSLPAGWKHLPQPANMPTPRWQLRVPADLLRCLDGTDESA